jgi:hypothetical protein
LLGKKIGPAAIFLNIADTLKMIVRAGRKEEYHEQNKTDGATEK